MNTKPLFKIDEIGCLKLLKTWAFGSLITSDLIINHIPYVYIDEHMLELHLSSNNPQLKSLDQKPFLFSILGPHTLILADYYINKPNVPTWNYVSITVRGTAELMSESYNNECIDRMLARFEPELLEDKDTLPDLAKHKKLRGIVCVRLQIESIEGIAKLGQNKAIEDQLNVLQNLREAGHHEYCDFVNTWLLLPE